MTTEDGEVIGEEDHEGNCRAFIQHNIIRGEPPPVTERRKTKRVPPSEGMMRAVRRALTRSKSSSAPDPYGVTWRLLKMLRSTRLGAAVLEDVGQMVGVGNRYYGEEEWREMAMVERGNRLGDTDERNPEGDGRGRLWKGHKLSIQQLGERGDEGDITRARGPQGLGGLLLETQDF